MTLPDQPPPVGGHGDVWLDVIQSVATNPMVPLDVIDAMGERRFLGLHRYGTPLRYDNGRDPWVDAAQEASTS